MSEKQTKKDDTGQNEQSILDSDRRSFITKASAGGVIGLGAVLGLSAEVGAQARKDKIKPGQPLSAEEKIVQRALTDNKYRQQLISNPRATVAEAIGSALPANVQFKVIEESPDMVYIVLPHLSQEVRARLTKTDLEDGGALAAAGPLSWFRTCKPKPCKCSSLSVCKD